jgi:hypothetical protein
MFELSEGELTVIREGLAMLQASLDHHGDAEELKVDAACKTALCKVQRLMEGESVPTGTTEPEITTESTNQQKEK